MEAEGTVSEDNAVEKAPELEESAGDDTDAKIDDDDIKDDGDGTEVTEEEEGVNNSINFMEK